MPRPRSLPRAFDSAFRCSYPSIAFTAFSNTAGKSPESYVMPDAAFHGISDGRIWLRRHRAEVRADIAVPAPPHRQKPAFPIQRQLGGHLMIAAMLVGKEAAGALVGPFHRPLQLARRMREADVLRINGALHPERAAH